MQIHNPTAKGMLHWEGSMTVETQKTETQKQPEEMDVNMLRSALQNTQPSGEVWLVAATDDLVGVLMTCARDAGVVISRADVTAAAKVNRDDVVIVELPSPDAEAILQTASVHGAFIVAILGEPTIESFTKAVRAGAQDVLAGKPTAEKLQSRVEKWKALRT